MTDRPRALAVLIAVFLLGCIAGSGALYLWFPDSKVSEGRPRQGFPGGPQQGRQRMKELLQLTPEQERQFGNIMAESRKQMDAVRAQDQPRIEAIFSQQQPKIQVIIAETNQKLMSVLNKDQQKKFEALWKEMNSRRRRPQYKGRDGDRGGGPGMDPPPPH